MITALEAYKLGNTKKQMESERIDGLVEQMITRKIEPLVRSKSADMKCVFTWQHFSDFVGQDDLFHCFNILKERLLGYGYSVTVSGNRTDPLKTEMLVKWEEPREIAKEYSNTTISEYGNNYEKV
jgi:hypothetical protein